jgi:hypothetical protein
MECYIQEHHLNQPPICHLRVKSRLNGTTWPKLVQDRFNKFCVTKSINKLEIYSHHIVLRSLGSRRLPLLGRTKTHKQGKAIFV